MDMEWDYDESVLVDQLTVGQLKWIRRLMVRVNRQEIRLRRPSVEEALRERGGGGRRPLEGSPLMTARTQLRWILLPLPPAPGGAK